MKIWKRPISVEILNSIPKGTADGHLGVEYIEVGDDFIVARIPFGDLTKDADGKLHPSLPVLLAESLGSVGAAFSCSPQFSAVGLSINANHFRDVESGWVTGTARPVEIGPSTHLWRIDLVDDQNQPVCLTHITLKLVESKALVR